MSFQPSALSFAVGVTAGVAGAAAFVAGSSGVLFALSMTQRSSWFAHFFFQLVNVILSEAKSNQRTKSARPGFPSLMIRRPTSYCERTEMFRFAQHDSIVRTPCPECDRPARIPNSGCRRCCRGYRPSSCNACGYLAGESPLIVNAVLPPGKLPHVLRVDRLRLRVLGDRVFLGAGLFPESFG